MPKYPGVGLFGWIQIAEEATYAIAPAAATARYDIESENLKPKRETLDDPTMPSARRARNIIIPGGSWVEGTIKARMNYHGMEPLLRGVLPAYSYTVGTKAHKFLDSAIVPKSFTIEINKGNIPTGKVNRYLGCYITAMRITGNTSSILMAEFDVVGQSMIENTTPMTAAVAPASLPIPFHQCDPAQVLEGSGATPGDCIVTGFGVSLSTPFDAKRFHFSDTPATEQPVPDGFLECTWTFDEDWTDYLLLQSFRLNTAAATGLRMFFKQPAVFDGTHFRTLRLESKNVYAPEYDAPIDKPGRISQKVTYRAWDDPTSYQSALLVETINSAVALV